MLGTSDKMHSYSVLEGQQASPDISNVDAELLQADDVCLGRVLTTDEGFFPKLIIFLK